MNNTTEEACCCSCKCKRKKPVWKRLTGLALVVFAAIAVLRAFNGAPEAPAAATVKEDVAEASSLTVFYFHGRQRCMTCNRMEKMVHEVADNLPAVEVKVVNLDEPANEHYVADFGLTMRTVVLQRESRFTVLDKCWSLAHDEAVFKDYLARNIAAFAAVKE
ncbi:MAG: nitrophenyl compound nitroreductase subunit ArsF family protein [Kiritimatiellia bacterium]